MRSVGKSFSKITSKKKKAETSFPTEQKGKSTLVQEEKRSIKNTLPSTKKIKIRTSKTNKTIYVGTNQSISLIVIDESPQVFPKDHNLLVIVDAMTHTMVNE